MNPDFEPFEARGLEPTEAIEATTTIAAASTDVWAAISGWGNLENVHPFCASNDVERWPGPDGKDKIRYYSGVEYHRAVAEWRDGIGYDLVVGPTSGAIAFARWMITSTGPTHCTFGIEVTSFVRSDVTGPARDDYIETVIEGAIPPYLDSVVKGVGHFVESGDPVVRNQFGSHPIYSPALR